MQTMRDVLGAWLVAGALGLAVVGIWGPSAPQTGDGQAVACSDSAAQGDAAVLHGADVPRGGWSPSAELTGVLPPDDGRLTSYEVAEERNLLAIGTGGAMTSDTAQGSITSLNPTSMC